MPSGPLTSLPIHVLVTRPVDPALAGMARYREAAWLALQQPVTVLPSVGSLRALRQLGPSLAREPYIAFGNPLLLGPSGNDKRPWAKQHCAQPAAPPVGDLAGPDAYCAGALEPAAGHHCRHLFKLARRGRDQVLALLGAQPCQRRIAARDQPLAGIVCVREADQVALVEQASWRSRSQSIAA